MPNSLGASLVRTFNVGGSTVETIDAAQCANLQTDFTGTMSFEIVHGTPASNAFATSPRAEHIRVDVSLGDGRWKASNGASGQLGGAALATLVGQLKAFRNQAEAWMLANVFAGNGSQVNWS